MKSYQQLRAWIIWTLQLEVKAKAEKCIWANSRNHLQNAVKLCNLQLAQLQWASIISVRLSFPLLELSPLFEQQPATGHESSGTWEAQPKVADGLHPAALLLIWIQGQQVTLSNCWKYRKQACPCLWDYKQHKNDMSPRGPSLLPCGKSSAEDEANHGGKRSRERKRTKPVLMTPSVPQEPLAYPQPLVSQQIILIKTILPPNQRSWGYSSLNGMLEDKSYPNDFREWIQLIKLNLLLNPTGNTNASHWVIMILNTLAKQPK